MEVILVHGLWYGPWAMNWLAQRLRRAAFTTRQFAYRPTKAPLAVHAQELARVARQSRSTAVHFVGHSLGGLVILQMLAQETELSHGRVVLLGTPLRGSRVARRMLQLPGGALLLGQVAVDLCGGGQGWPEGLEIGMIAGSKALGLGRLLGRPEALSDGTVGVSETDAPELTGRVVLPVSHTGMLSSSQVAQQTVGFLQNGRFSVPAASRGR